jgi:uncharacterized protein
VKLNNAFSVPLPPPDAWQVLMDIERIARCVPGAEVLETVDDRTYKGRISVRLGPVHLAFNGKVAFVEIDETQHYAKLNASGTDASGRGGAQANTVFRLVANGEETEVQLDTDLQLSGSVAQYGRASGMIADVAGQIVDEFAECLRKQLDRPPPKPDPETIQSGADPLAPANEAPARPMSGIAIAWSVLLRRVRRWLGTWWTRN